MNIVLTNDPFFYHYEHLAELLPSLPSYIQRSYAFYRISEWVLGTYKHHIIYYYHRGEVHSMASYDDVKFCSISLTEKDKPALENFIDGHEADMDMAFDMLSDDNLKCSFAYSEKQSGWCVTLIPQKENRTNAGKLLTSWAGTPLEAFWISVYKHVELCSRGTWDVQSQSKWG